MSIIRGLDVGKAKNVRLRRRKGVDAYSSERGDYASAEDEHLPTSNLAHTLAFLWNATTL